MANLIPFTKRFESSENLVNLLESRGLQICDRNKAIQYLDNIGYYRLSAYMYSLLKMPKTAHLYKEGSSFEMVMMLYRFDKKLLETSMPFIATLNKIAYASVLPNVLGCLSMCLSHGSRLLLLLEMPVVIIQEYGTNKMLFSQQFPIVPQENG